jgi:hypothetical protein
VSDGADSAGEQLAGFPRVRACNLPNRAQLGVLAVTRRRRLRRPSARRVTIKPKPNRAWQSWGAWALCRTGAGAV